MKFTAAFGVLLWLSASQPAGAYDWQYVDVDRVVAVSDVHGAQEALTATLKNAGVIGDDLAWSGQRTHLVIVGDIVDRGPDSRATMDFLMRLEQEAESAGGKVHVLIGNHEAMNIAGDLRYVSADEFAAFAGEETAAERDRWFEAYRTLRSPAIAATPAVRENFDARFPPGFFAHRRAFAADGKYGRWLLSKPVITVIDGTAFVHGGLSPMVTDIGLAGVNELLVAELRTYTGQLRRLYDGELLLPTDNFYSHAKLLSDYISGVSGAEDTDAAVADVIRLNASRLHALDGPLWYRGNVYCNEVIEGDKLDAALASIGARRVVIGHTPTAGRRVLERFDGRVYEIDTGMLHSYYNGAGSALVIENDRLYVVGQHSSEALAAVPQPREVGARPAAPLSAGELELLLQSGEIVARRSDTAGHVILSVSDGENAVDARFVKRLRRGVYPDVAAYRLDRMLDFDMVPVTVQREVNGDDGSLQFLPAGWIDESQRQKDKSGGGAFCPLPDQWDAMMVFDVLIGNGQRSAPSMRYDESSWQLMLVSHENAFSTLGTIPSRFRNVALDVGPTWKAALTALTDERLEERLADVIDKRRIGAIAERRDLLLSQ